MCGIAGLSGGRPDQVLAMLEKIRYRGPDARGVMPFPAWDFTLGHARLAIIDLDDRSNQPMVSADGRHALAFNGEIYNYRELRARLQGLGREFLTSSDTEVVLQWLIEFGPDGIGDFDGMFAFAFFDDATGECLLARDPIGEKPLFYALQDGRFSFASELRCLTNLEWVDRRLDEESLRDYLCFLYPAPPATFYRGIRELEPGCLLICSPGRPGMSVRRYFDLAAELPVQPSSPAYASEVDIFRGEFRRAVESRLVADVPVGVYLSGGLDSNAIASEAVRIGAGNLAAFTMSYASDAEAGEYDESRIAVACARHYGMPDKLVRYPGAPEIQVALARVVDLFGQPFGNATCLPAADLAAEVARDRRACLVGDGGDELLVGYPRYRAVLLSGYIRRLPAAVRRVMLALAAIGGEGGRRATWVRRVRQFFEAAGRPPAQAYLHWVGYADVERINRALGTTGESRFYRRLREVFEKFGRDPVRAAEIVDFLSFVPFNLMQAADRTSMRHSVELRSPFLAPALVRRMLGLSSRNRRSLRRTKRLLVDALRDQLPPPILDQPKRPFNPPMRGFIRDNLDWIEAYLAGTASARLPRHVDRHFIAEEIAAFRAGARDNSTYLWGLCVLECWLRREAGSHLDGAAPGESVP